MGESGIRQAIDNLSAAIAADPGKARAKNQPATARYTGGLTFEVTGPQGQRVATDMPPAMGGAASAPNPGWYFRGALASCTATVIAMRAAKLGIALQTLEVTVESDADHRGILGLDEKVSAGQKALRTVVKISGDAAPGKLRELVEWADAHSPVGCTLKDAPPCSLTVEVV
jgi:uncharacterized OsmC-like protein